jgi:hypothetical protein
MRSMVYIALIFILLGCERQIPLVDLDFNQKLVVNSYNHNNSPIAFSLGSSVNIGSNPSLSGLNGEVEILLKEDNNNIYYATKEVRNGEVELPLTAKVGKTYELQLRFDSLPTIRAIDKIPELPPVMLEDTLLEDDLYYRPKITIKDIPESDFFMLQVFAEGTVEQNGMTDTVLKPIEFRAIDRIFVSNINTHNAKVNYVLFNDELFTNRSKQITLNVEKSKVAQAGFKPLRMEVRLSSLSKNMYDYYISLLENNHIYGGPLATYTLSNGNVENGLGIFAFYTYKRGWFSLK